MKVLLEHVSQNRERWLELRKGTIGSSSISTVVGMNRFQTPLELWCEMTGKTPPIEDNDHMWLGREMEPVIGKLFTRRTGELAVPADILVGHDKYDWVTASPDFWVLYDSAKAILEDENRKILEAKNSRWKNAWEEGAPTEYLIQLNWQLATCGLYEGYCAGFLGGDIDSFEPEAFEYSPALFEQCLNMGGEFMELVRKDEPPEAGPGDSKLIEKIQGEREEQTVHLTGMGAVYAARYIEACEKASLASKALDNAKDEQSLWKGRLLQAIGNKIYATTPDGLFITAKNIKCAERVQPGYEYVRVFYKHKEMRGRNNG